jgi:Domain of unknown function (DUF1858)
MSTPFILKNDKNHDIVLRKRYNIRINLQKNGGLQAMSFTVDKNTIIGEAINADPEIRKIIEKHFGTGCFTCPGINMESIGFGSLMHNLDPQKIVDEINAALAGK